MSTLGSVVEGAVGAAVKGVLGAELVEAAGFEVPLGDLGLDSLDLVEVLRDVGHRLRLDLTMTALQEQLADERRRAQAAPGAPVHPSVGAVTIRTLVALAMAAQARIDRHADSGAGDGASPRRTVAA